ncbi:S-adenosyl-L-methionine-dependent methyltransferase, partial [Mycena pura]
YDTDGNFLQRVDDGLVNDLLPSVLSEPVECVVDLGCGTGRNTAKLLQYNTVQRVIGLDATPGMLARARARPGMDDARLQLWQYDLLADSPACASFLPPGGADGVVSTLVIEHLPALPVFFVRVHGMLRSGGWLLVTNMHEDMGALTGANFLDADGVRVTMDKFVHTAAGVRDAALACGFELRGAPEERRVEDEGHAGALGGGAPKFVGVKVLFGMVFVKGA